MEGNGATESEVLILKESKDSKIMVSDWGLTPRRIGMVTLKVMVQT